MTSYNTIATPAQAEFVEKKSRFIATLFPCQTEQQATELIDAMKKEHWNAAHNVSAYILRGDTATPLKRSSDDGEPQGTAGHPILDVLDKEGLTDVVCIVTRYFGGTLLGTGGLVRAYTDATKAGLEQADLITMCVGQRIKIHTDYNLIGKVLYELGQRGLAQEDSDYTDVICLTLTLPLEEYEGFVQRITEISAGKSRVEAVEQRYFSMPFKRVNT